ncbi:SIR2 family NAD-dependent protein deacylase [Phreatobacter stygius]|uniref:protein acetyllysine N-acetyltransferase n=1 Tax=Phreatobacter stygius TaxID=1940610 RepID=A0A4D7BDB7_9HYPH|nr:Sir2 family NAD-dependent protein deacetylase [Phreatobacter stygius]QCI68860.1 NAD-dependent deacetylase [Phreatobacter stygius]
MDAELKTAATDLASLVRQSSRALAFTGAGLSTECGIPDFRSPGGLWTKNKPIPFEAFVSSRAARTEAWRRKFVMDESFKAAVPGRGHRALAAMVRAGRLAGIVTQNIDNLHQVSGVPDDRLVELHGNGTYATCLDCARRYELTWVKAAFDAGGGAAPDCTACGGPVKAATISFGQAMPEDKMRLALDWSVEADLFIAIGTSLVVHPAAGLPVAAKRSGARLVIINREATPLDEIADLVISADIGTLLDQLMEHLAIAGVH